MAIYPSACAISMVSKSNDSTMRIHLKGQSNLRASDYFKCTEAHFEELELLGDDRYE
jgi:hypothetical protein